MSEQQIIQQLNRIIKMMVQQTLPNKEVFNSKEAGLYMGLSPDYVCTLARRNLFPSFRPNNGKRFYKKRDLHAWLLSSGRESSSSIQEVEKLAILQQEGG